MPKFVVMVRLVHIFCALLLGVLSFQSLAQAIQRRLIVTYKDDFLPLKDVRGQFDDEGNYSLLLEKNDTVFLIDQKGKYGPFFKTEYVDDIVITHSKNDSTDSVREIYFVPYQGTKVFGPIKLGRIVHTILASDKKNVALWTKVYGKINLYINSTLIASLKEEDAPDPEHKWCKFEKNGDVSYCYKIGKQYKTFKNGLLIDSSNVPTYYEDIEIEQHCKVDSSVLKNYSEVSHMVSNSNCNTAYFGVRDYYLYRVLNNLEQKAPITKYGVRPTPLGLSPDGHYWCVYQTDDSSYFYHDDTLVLKAHITQTLTLNISDLIENYGKYADENLWGFSNRADVYIVYKNAISKPIKPIISVEYLTRLYNGSVLSSGFGENGYWLIQKVGEGKFHLMVNNRDFEIGDYIDEKSVDALATVRNFCFLTQKEFIFYTLEGNSFFRNSIRL